MPPEYQPLYQDMLADIARCWGLDLPEKERAENCFWIARRYGEKLEEGAKRKGFADEKEEIDFFKNTKPLFGCYTEYFIILAEALQFEPQGDTIHYWEHEGKRFARFCQKNQLFVDYYLRQEVRSDALYFLRENDLAVSARPGARQFNHDPAFSTFHEQVLRSYLAHQKFDDFCKSKMQTREV